MPLGEFFSKFEEVAINNKPLGAIWFSWRKNEALLNEHYSTLTEKRLIKINKAMYYCFRYKAA